jgi:uncharacterized protein (TIGR02996 family)
VLNLSRVVSSSHDHDHDEALRVLRRNVLATPEDTAQRLVYADVLAQSGANDEAAIIIASHALDLARAKSNLRSNSLDSRSDSRLDSAPDSPLESDSDVDREAEILEGYLVCLHTAKLLWSKRLSRFGVTDFELRNGLVDAITIRAKELVQYLDALFAVAPIRELHIRGIEELRTKEVTSLLASPHLDRLRALAITGATMELGRVQAIFGAESSIATRVASLDLSNTQWDTQTTNNLTQFTRPCAATKVILSGARSRDVGDIGSGRQSRPVCAALLGLFPEARHVVIHGSAPTIMQAVPAIRPRKLERLDLAIPPTPNSVVTNTRTSIPAEICARFCAEKTANLIELRLKGFNGVADFVMAHLSGAPFRRALRVLHLGDRGSWGSAQRARLGAIVREATELDDLALEGVTIGSELASFFTSTAPRSLSLTGANLTEESIDALVKHSNPRVLRNVAIARDRVLTHPSVREKLVARFGAGFSYEL